MPWFITAVISNETLERQPHYKSCRSRTFGFANDFNEAFQYIQENRGNMEECLYDYLVVEYIEKGIHPMVHVEQWFKWCTLTRKWTMLIDKPKEASGTTNWALG